MSDYSLEGRIKRRLLMEHPALDHESTNWEGRPEWLFVDADLEPPTTAEAARIAALEAEDTANPIAATAVVRKDAVTEIAPPDVEALLAAFNRPEEDQ